MFRLLCLLLLVCTACDVASLTQPAPVSAWGDIFRVAQAPQSDAPALWLRPDGMLALWVGSDSAGVHQDARAISDAGELSPAVVLPLPPRHPFDQQTLPADASRLHLLWLDEGDDETLWLYTALINSSLGIERGPTRVSDSAALRYDVADGADGTLWAAWSGGLLAEPEIRLSRIDDSGRPRIPQPVASRADHPVFVRIDANTLYLYWLSVPDGVVYRARLDDGVPLDLASVTVGARLEPGDRLERFSAGLDDTHTYLFWNVTRANGSRETWWTSGVSGGVEWAQPTRLQIDPLPNAPLDTEFGGAPNLANSGSTPLSWAAPLNGQHNMLAVAAQSDSALGVVYLRAGLIIGYEAVVPGARLAGAPGIYADDAGHLALAWAQPTDSGTADLNVTTTRTLTK